MEHLLVLYAKLSDTLSPCVKNTRELLPSAASLVNMELWGHKRCLRGEVCWGLGVVLTRAVTSHPAYSELCSLIHNDIRAVVAGLSEIHGSGGQMGGSYNPHLMSEAKMVTTAGGI